MHICISIYQLDELATKAQLCIVTNVTEQENETKRSIDQKRTSKIRRSKWYCTFACSFKIFADHSFTLCLVVLLQIKVHLPNGKVVNASVQHYRVAYNMLFVTTESFPDLRAACLLPIQVGSSTQLLAASLCLKSDKFLVTTGVLTDSPIGDERPGIMWSTCSITEVSCHFLS